MPAVRGDLNDVELVRRKRRGLDLYDLRGSKCWGSLLRQLWGGEGPAVPYVRFLQWTREPVLPRLWNAPGRSFCTSDAARLRPGHRGAWRF